MNHQSKVLVVRHAPENHFGVFASVLDSLNLSYRYLEAYGPAYRHIGAFEAAMIDSRPVGVIVLGGPQHAMDDELAAERRWLKSLLEQKIPVFGICLGSQMLSAVLGGTVHRNRHPEVGWVEICPTDEGKTDPVFRHFSRQRNHRQFHWHNDSFTLPEGAVALATSDTCPQQAFRYGDHVLAVQFHPEISLDVVQGWLKESTSLTAEEKRRILSETQVALEMGGPDIPVQTSVALFRAFCERHFL